MPRLTKLNAGVTAACLLALASVVRAGDSSGSIVGQVTDPTLAGIPFAMVRATRIPDHVAAETKTDAHGYYSLAFLPAGAYNIEAAARGFKVFQKSNVVLQSDDTLSLPLVLEVSSVQEQVSVSGESDALQGNVAARSVRWDPAKLKEIPLIGRQAYSLISMTPGVIFTQEQFGTSSFTNLHGFDTQTNFVINGGLPGRSIFLLNGAPVSLTGQWQYTPTLDSIEEFKVLTNNFEAEYGRTSGGIISTTLRGGTDHWHGTVFEYFHNAVFDANTTENNAGGAPRGKHNTHQFGGAMGGPLRKGKDYIFANYEGFREIAAYPIVSDTPPLDLRTGKDFTRYGIKVYDPMTAHFCREGVDTAPGAACFGSFIRDPFPNNVIPDSRISPVARNILALYPAPNGRGLTQNFLALGNTGDYVYDQPMVRWDHNLKNSDRLTFLAALSRGYQYQSNNGFPPPADTGSNINDSLDQNYLAEWTHVASGSTVLNGRLSFGRFTQFFPDSSGAGNLTAADLGMLYMPQAPTVTGNSPPHFNLENFSSIVGNTYTWNSQNQWDFQPSLIHTRGRHVLHIGAELVYASIASAGPGRGNGEFTFGRAWTDQYTLRPRNGKDGSSVADLLLGTPQSGFIDYNGSSYRSWPYWAIYVQDYWRIAPRLTLNLGLRYDVQLPFVERSNRLNAGFDFSVKNPLSDQIVAGWKQIKLEYDKLHPKTPYPAPPAAIYGGRLFTSSNARRPYQTDWTDIQPRLGIAWTFLPKTVLRAGAGIFYRTATQMNQSDGFNQRTNYISSLDGGVHPSAAISGPYSLQNPFPSGILSPSGSSLGLLTNVGQPITFDGTQRPIPRTYEYSAGIQRELPWNVLVDASYVGSQTVHDSMPVQYDALPYAQFTAGAANPSSLNRLVPNPFSGILPITSDLGGQSELPVYQLLTPYPLFSGILETTNPWARYRYDSLQVLAQKRVLDNASTGVFLFLLSYTFSKSFEASHRLNPWNLAEPPVHELTALDKPQILAISGVWDLPVGWGRRWFNQGGRMAGAFLNGWAVDWILTYSSGYPVNQPDAVFTCGSYDAPGGQTEAHWFNNNPECYQARKQYTLRTNPDRFSNIRMPTAPQLHASIEKTFWMTEKYSLQFRGEAFNLTNTAIQGAPNTDFKNPRFGELPVGQINFPRYVQIAAKLVF